MDNERKNNRLDMAVAAAGFALVTASIGAAGIAVFDIATSLPISTLAEGGPVRVWKHEHNATLRHHTRDPSAPPLVAKFTVIEDAPARPADTSIFGLGRLPDTSLFRTLKQ